MSGCGQPRDDPACHWGTENGVGGLRDDRRSFWAEQQVKKNGSKNAVLFLMKPLGEIELKIAQSGQGYRKTQISSWSLSTV